MKTQKEIVDQIKAWQLLIEIQNKHLKHALQYGHKDSIDACNSALEATTLQIRTLSWVLED